MEHPAELMHRDSLGSAHRHGLEDIGDDHHFDVCVIGSGASGAVATDVLIEAGLDVLVIEEGPRLAANATNEALDRTSPTALAREGNGEWGERGWAWTTRNLGGGTVFYGGASFRYREFDFDPTARIKSDDLEVRWPISLADLEPYYAEMERRLAVVGIPTSTRSLAGPPETLSLPGEHLWRGAQALGYSPVPTPVAIDRTLCDNCSLCICVQCLRGAKRDAVTAFLKPLADRSNLALRTGFRAVALEQTERHRVVALKCIELATGRALRFRARRFVVACNAIQSAALLLRSASDIHPQGLGNRNDLVGRGLCMKLSEYSYGEVAGVPASDGGHPIGYRGPFSTISVLDHYLDDRCPTGVGGLMYEAKFDDWRRLGGPTLVARVETIMADHPSATNRVRLASQRDEWGLQRIMIDYRTDPRDAARLSYMLDRSTDWLRAAGVEDVRREASNYTLGSTHLHGTCRAGHDPARSVVNADGRIHGVENVFVIDGGYMPYPGGLNPTLTIQANALRIARLLAANAYTN